MKNMKLGQRLIGSFMLMAFIVAVTGAFGAWSMKRVGTKIQDTLKNLSLQQKQVLLMEVTQKLCHVNLLQAAMVRTEAEKFEEYSEDYQTMRELYRSQVVTLLKGNTKMGLKPLQAGSDMELRTQKALETWSALEKVAEELLARKGANDVRRGRS